MRNKVSLLTTIFCIFITANSTVSADQSGLDWSIDSTLAYLPHITTDPSVLKTVTVRCRQDGYLHATAVVDMTVFRQSGYTGDMRGYVSLTKNSLERDWDIIRNSNEPSENYLITNIMLQRVDRCRENKSVTYRVLGFRNSAASPNSRARSSLVVTYHQRKL